MYTVYKGAVQWREPVHNFRHSKIMNNNNLLKCVNMYFIRYIEMYSSIRFIYIDTFQEKY